MCICFLCKLIFLNDPLGPDCPAAILELYKEKKGSFLMFIIDHLCFGILLGPKFLITCNKTNKNTTCFCLETLI